MGPQLFRKSKSARLLCVSVDAGMLRPRKSVALTFDANSLTDRFSSDKCSGLRRLHAHGRVIILYQL